MGSAHIGWQSWVQSRHYASLKHTALNARSPHLEVVAGRSGRDQHPHPMWQCLAQAPGEGFWQRVQALAAAAGFLPGVELGNSEFQSLVAERVATGSREREDSPAYLLKRLKLACRERQHGSAQAHPTTRGGRADHRASEMLRSSRSASERGNLGLPQSSKALSKILVLKHGELAFAQHANEGRSWFAWLSDQGRDDPRVLGVSTKTWKAFKESALARLRAE
jgi:hypothetical protein